MYVCGLYWKAAFSRSKSGIWSDLDPRASRAEYDLLWCQWNQPSYIGIITWKRTSLPLLWGVKRVNLHKTWKTSSDGLPSTLLYRQIRDTVHWMFSEPMLVYYIGVFRDAFWPNGKLAPPPRAKSDEQKQETKQRAQQKLLENIPGEITLILLKDRFNN